MSKNYPLFSGLRATHRHATLSRRERQTMALVVLGRLNKQIAAELGISEVTVKAHRGKMMRKMKAESVAQLVIMSAKIGAGLHLRDLTHASVSSHWVRTRQRFGSGSHGVARALLE